MAVEIDSGGDDDDDEDDEEDDKDDDAGGDDKDAEEDVLAMIRDRRRHESSTLKASTSTAATAAGDATDEDDNDGEDGERAAGGALGVDAEDEASVCGSLFKGLVFYLAREVPREPLLFAIRCGSIHQSVEPERGSKGVSPCLLAWAYSTESLI